MRKLHVLVTMDVEPVKQRSIWTGPEDKESSERFITAYRDISVGYGFMPSFFVHPEAAQIHADLLLEYRKQGATLGLHVHPTKFHFPDYQYEFGGYSGEKQREIVQSAAEEWEKALASGPGSSVPGHSVRMMLQHPFCLRWDSLADHFPFQAGSGRNVTASGLVLRPILIVLIRHSAVLPDRWILSIFRLVSILTVRQLHQHFSVMKIFAPPAEKVLQKSFSSI